MYPRAAVKNQATRSLERIIDNRLDQRSTSLVFPGEGASPSNQTLLIDSDLAHLENELRWRLERRHSGPVGTVQPFVPGLDAAEQLLLLEAERLWAGLGGYYPENTPISKKQMLSLEARIDDALSRLQVAAKRFLSALPDAEIADGQSGKRSGPDMAIEADNFQLQRSMFALRAGGLFGVGLGQGRPEAVPGVTEDVPMAALGEALGFAGVGLVALLRIDTKLACRRTCPMRKWEPSGEAPERLERAVTNPERSLG